MKILIIDDEPILKSALTKPLQKLGINTIFANSGKAGIKLLETDNDIELILVDLMMPIEDGFQTLTNIHSLKLNIPVIAMSASATRSDRVKAEQYGFDGLLVKPIGPINIKSLVDKYDRTRVINIEDKNTDHDDTQNDKEQLVHLSTWYRKMESQIYQQDIQEILNCCHKFKENNILLKFPELIKAIEKIQKTCLDNEIRKALILDVVLFIREIIHGSCESSIQVN